MYVPSKRAMTEMMSQGTSAEAMRAMLLKINGIRRRVQSIEHDIQKADEKHQKLLDEFDRELRSVRLECKHYDTTYHPDAAGGSDSHTTCNICGAEL